jgi:hypothetical protein
MTTLVIGDIHGCWFELQALLDKAGLAEGDGIVALGDFVDRGPDSGAVLAYLRDTPGVRALLGNHERKHLRGARGEVRLAASQIIARQQLAASYADALTFMAGLPTVIETPYAVLVHGFLEPGVPLAEQDERIVCGTLGGESILQKRYAQPWYELYDGERPVIVGHQNYTGTTVPFVYRDRVYGLDTGCCRGRALTGLLLPAFTFVSVPSRGDYWAESLRRYRDFLVAQGLDMYEDDLETVLRYVHRRRDAILTQLRAEGDYDDVPPREQAKRYAALVGESLLAGSLYAARTGDIDLDRLRTFARTPERLRALMREAGLGVNTDTAAADYWSMPK